MAVFDEEFDVIVVGAGVMGSSTAYQVSKRGHKVLLLEQFDFLHMRGSSHGESRTIRSAYPEEYYYPMVKESYRLWEEAESHIGYKVYFKAQQLDIGSSEDKRLREVIATCQKYSVPHEILDRQQVSDKFSGSFDIPDNWVGVCSSDGGVIKATKAVSMFQTLALQNGTVLRDCMKVKDIRKDGVC
nr:putative sarcosine oxidase [Quercus suber]